MQPLRRYTPFLLLCLVSLCSGINCQARMLLLATTLPVEALLAVPQSVLAVDLLLFRPPVPTVVLPPSAPARLTTHHRPQVRAPLRLFLQACIGSRDPPRPRTRPAAIEDFLRRPPFRAIVQRLVFGLGRKPRHYVRRNK